MDSTFKIKVSRFCVLLTLLFSRILGRHFAGVGVRAWRQVTRKSRETKHTRARTTSWKNGPIKWAPGPVKM